MAESVQPATNVCCCQSHNPDAHADKCTEMERAGLHETLLYYPEAQRRPGPCSQSMAGSPSIVLHCGKQRVAQTEEAPQSLHRDCDTRDVSTLVFFLNIFLNPKIQDIHSYMLCIYAKYRANSIY